MIFIALLSTTIGLALGLLGGGGSILAVPVLTYGADLSPKESIAMSLLVVGTTAAFAMIAHARQGNVAYRTGLLFAGAAMAGGFLGGLAASWFSGQTLLLLFALMMLVTAAAMSRPKPDDDNEGNEASLSVGKAILEGLVVGAVTGLVGAGGGFLVVPALVLFGGLSMHRAIGTSLMVIALKSFAAFAGHATHVDVDVPLAVIVTGAAIVGSIAGGALASKLNAKTLRTAFSGLVLVMGGYVIWREASAVYAIVGIAVAVVVIAGLRLMAKRPVV